MKCFFVFFHLQYMIITDRGRSLTTLTKFEKRKNMHTVDISCVPYLPYFVNIATLSQEKNLAGNLERPKGRKWDVIYILVLLKYFLNWINLPRQVILRCNYFHILHFDHMNRNECHTLRA